MAVLADDHPHRAGDAAILDHPQPRRGGVDEDVAAGAARRDGARPLDIGEDQPLIMAGAGVEGGDRRGIGSAVGRQAVRRLELAQRRGQRGVGAAVAEAEAAPQHARALGAAAPSILTWGRRDQRAR